MKPKRMSRRDCLAWLARAASIRLAAELCPHSAHADGAIPNFIALPNESARLLDKPEAILTRTRAGVACLSVYCTHRRNKLEVNKGGEIKCPVHDSIFDLSGTPISGPASRPLTWYSTSVNEDGDISIDPSKAVAQGQWAKLPAWAQKK